MKYYPVTEYELARFVGIAVVAAICFSAAGLVVGMMGGTYLTPPRNVDLFIGGFGAILLIAYGAFNLLQIHKWARRIKRETTFVKSSTSATHASAVGPTGSTTSSPNRAGEK